jgi:uncharacterized protein YdeI (YjbR/CyaY-like superfamily)
MEPHFFKTPAHFRKWLEKNYKSKTELLVGFYKKGSGKESITWPESVDEALCFGWIDGVRKSLDSDSYTIRFTPRKPNSIWSAVNIDKMEALLKKGLVKPEGIAAYEKRTASKSKVYAFEQEEDPVLSEDFESEFRKNKHAYDFFMKQAPSYKKVVLHWINTARQEKTQRSRFDKLVKASEEGKRL